MAKMIARLLAIGSLFAAAASLAAQPSSSPTRARDLGAAFDGTPGPLNSITDVPGVLVGHTTLIRGKGAHAVRTGVTAILPRRELGYYPASVFVLNGDAEMSGAIFAEEFGMLRSPIMLTGTASNGTVYNGVIKWSFDRRPERPVYMPVVADTWDADLSDAFAFPLTEAHVRAALDTASSGPIDEGSVGGGTGMVCFGFKGGIGTASRQVSVKQSTFTIGVLVQCNQGARESLLISGRPVGKAIVDLPVRYPEPEVRQPERSGSIIIVVATDAPLNATTLKALAKRAALGLARTGGVASPSSGDIVIAFSTAKMDYDPVTYRERGEPRLWQYAANGLYSATVHATEEAIVNSMVAARTMYGRDGSVAYGIPHDRVRELLKQ